MSILVFQFVIKQWDKSQNTAVNKAERVVVPVRYSISNKPEYFLFNKPCILEQYGDDLPTNVFNDGRIKTAFLSDSLVQLDRFQVYADPDGLLLKYQNNQNKLQTIGSLNQGWIQACYHWRYSVVQSGQIYWMYEEITLNAACLTGFSADHFLTTEPNRIFND